MTLSDSLSATNALASARRTLSTEIAALESLSNRLDNTFHQAVKLVLACSGRVVVTGIGKSGHIGRKMAATLASTGSPAFFMHGVEAIHGDLGMLTPQDVVIAISYSGTAEELITVLSVCKRMGIPIIAITGNPESELAGSAQVHLSVRVEQEACPLNLAPTASTTATMALGDALAVACLEARGFGAEDFARSHPGGALGRRLLTHVRDIMRHGQALPIVQGATPIQEALEEMSRKGMGMTIVVNNKEEPIGIFTDGDLRRLISKVGDIRHLNVSDGMSLGPRSVSADALAVEAASIMESNKLSQVVVVNTQGKLIGALHMHDLMAAKVI
ncbi:KpsF/GutQ family sugar-phosphate isomerase [Pusillimonas sp. DMV24BSW_D]|uniref:KpsF/GutQ family sugar-phosphate isomerase n=1 Tax=Neopusillimonas aestuarii TaxID=2716226 RepID=UPI00140E0DAD|nr:KpsF/GutQ family sugar-phosphate isomerase [Pusillimonas sp. DMV24BSW_D]QIM48675.1 KpsF/GutQ family sugar-phosphate isomerase [Pusillimonas sp. DMV24BSW_D]